MKSISLLGILILLAVNSYAQQVVASSGNSISAAGYKVDWTLGEPAIETISGSNHMLTQGLHQTKLLATAISENDFPGLEVKVYPNPTGRFLNIEVIQTGNEQFLYELTDIRGRQTMVKQMQSNVEEIDMGRYVSGMYLIRVLNAKNEDVKTYKIFKN